MKLEKTLASPSFLRGFGFFLGTLLLVEVNAVASRHVFRGSFAKSEEFEISGESQRYFESVRDRIRVTGFVSKGDRQAELLTLVLEDLRLLGVPVTTIDPDRDRTRFAAAIEGEEFDDRIPLAMVSTDSGRVLVSADPSRLDFPTLVEKLSRAASEVTRETRKKLCVSEGHGERSPIDSSPAGASHFAAIAEHAGVEIETVFGAPAEMTIASCAALVVLGQTRAFRAEETEILARGLAEGTPIAVYVDPIVGPEKRVEKSGLDPLLTTLGLAAKNNVVLEHDVAQRPQGYAEETFFPSSSDHPLADAKRALGPSFTFSRELELLPSSLATVVYRTSERATTRTRLGDDERPSEEGHSSIVAVTVEGKTNRGAPVRAAVFGTSSPISNLALGGDSGREHRALARRTLSFLFDETLAPMGGDEEPKEREALSEDFVRKIIGFVVVIEPLFLLAIFVAIAEHRRAKRKEALS